MKNIRRLGQLIILLLFGSLITVATAHAQSSDNYRMPWYSADSSGGGISTGNGIKLYSNVGQSIVGDSSNSKYKLTSGYGAFFRRDTRPLVMIIASLDNDLGAYWEQVINSAEKALDGGQHVRILIDGPGDGNSFVYDLTPDKNNFCPSIRWNLLCGRYEEGVNRWTWTEDVSHPVSLYRFMTEAMDAYPHAGSVTLSLIGHGSGWGADVLPGQPRSWKGQPRSWKGQDIWPDRPDNPSNHDRSNGFLWDDFIGEGFGSTASSISDLRLILEGVLEHTGRKIDLLYFDACSMGMAEVAYELRDTVRYLLVSESTAWATFAYDQMIGAIKRGMDGQEIGEAWLKVETDLLKSRSGYPFALGLYDQSKMQGLATAMETLSKSLGTVSTTQRARIIQAATATERVESNFNGTIDTEDSYLDLKHFVEQISARFSSNATVSNAAQAVQEAINTAVVRKESKSGRLLVLPNQTRNFDNTGGISFYFPSHNDELKREFFYNEHHLQWANATGWDAFLDGWHGTALVRAARSSQTPEMPMCNSTAECAGLAKPLPGPIPLPSPNTICVSSTSGGKIQGLPFRDEDILCYSPITNEWTLIFDGSIQKLPSKADINAFHILEDGSILISFDRPTTIPNFDKVDDSDIVRYIPPASGNGRGTWERFFTGKNAQLTSGGEDIDGMFQTDDGRIVVTFLGTANVTGARKIRRSDMLVFTPTELGETTKGTWKRYFIGKTEKLTTKNENLWGISSDPETNSIYMVTRGNFNANGLRGKKSDILQCIPTAEGNTPKCIYYLFWQGAEYAFARENLDGVQIMSPPEPSEVRVAYGQGTSIATSAPSQVAIESPYEPSIMPGMTRVLTYTVENLTNSQKSYTIRLEETAGWSIGVQPKTLTIPAGGEEVLSVEVTHKGQAVESELTLTVTDQSSSDVEAVDIIDLGEPEFDEFIYLPLVTK